MHLDRSTILDSCLQPHRRERLFNNLFSLQYQYITVVSTPNRQLSSHLKCIPTGALLLLKQTGSFLEF